MADYSIFVLGESNISITGTTASGDPKTLDGITQGDGSHLDGEFVTINATPFTEIFISDAGSETNFADNDAGQELDGAQVLEGVTYADGTRIEAEYQFVLRDDATGIEYTVLAVNINNSSPSYGTNEALAFVGQVPPTGVSLRVVSTSEGPSNGGPNTVDESEIVPLCFCRGTHIRTIHGDRCVESLQAGDQILREDGTAATLRRVFHAKLTLEDLTAKPTHAPVRIMAGALGSGLPKRDLMVSRQHRMMVTSKIAERMFDKTDVLVSAIRLAVLPGIFVDETVEQVDYYHLLFDTHEVILAEGAPAESLFTGAEALKSVDENARREILELFPEIARSDYIASPARHIPSPHLQKKLVARHAKNAKPVLLHAPQAEKLE